VSGWDSIVDVAEESTRVALRVVARILFGAEAIDAVRQCFPVLGEYTLRRGTEHRDDWPVPG
jgi:hypothetical protein